MSVDNIALLITFFPRSICQKTVPLIPMIENVSPWLFQASAPATDQMNNEFEQSNDSPQGQRLEKEWSSMSQCRALTRSSEVR